QVEAQGMQSIGSQTDSARAEHLNKGCFCIGLDEAALRSALERELNTPGLYELILERCPHIFSARPVFVSKHHLDRMAAVVQAVEHVVGLPGLARRDRRRPRLQPAHGFLARGTVACRAARGVSRASRRPDPSSPGPRAVRG